MTSQEYDQLINLADHRRAEAKETMADRKQLFPQGTRVVVFCPEYYKLPAETAIVTHVSWSDTFGNWSCRCEWPCGKICWIIQSDLRYPSTLHVN